MTPWFRSISASRSLRHLRLLSVLFIALLGAVACGGGAGREEASSALGAADLESGRKLYQQTCAMCHGFSGEGVQRLGKSLKDSEFVDSRSDGELVRFLIEGRAADHPDNDQGIPMPPRGGNPRLTDEDLGLIVGYLRSL